MMDRHEKSYEVVMTFRENLLEQTAARCRSFEVARWLAGKLLKHNSLRPVRVWVREVPGRRLACGGETRP